MSIFGTIMSKIFSHAEAAPAPTSATPSAAPTPPSAAPASPGSGAPTSSSTLAPPATPSQDTSAPSPAPATVDVGAVLDGLAAKSSQKLDWKHSIVDMMKLLDLDSSLAARKSLAQELHYGGDMDDSARMNIWLHKEVMDKLAANGGKVPADLQS